MLENARYPLDLAVVMYEGKIGQGEDWASMHRMHLQVDMASADRTESSETVSDTNSPCYACVSCSD